MFSRPFRPSVGGLERMSELLSEEFVRQGHSVTVITETLSTGGDQDSPVRIVRSSEPRAWKDAMRGSDVVLLMGLSVKALLAARRAGRPVVVSHHGAYLGQGPLGTAKEFAKRQLTRCTTNVACSEFVASRLFGRSRVVPNAMDSDVFWPRLRQTRARDFVACGRLVSDKGFDLAIDALSLLVQSGVDCTMTIIGDGPERSQLESRVHRLRLGAHCEFAGQLTGPTLASALAMHRCMIVPSTCEEAFGIVALEGLACCDHVIVTNRGGLPEAVSDFGIVVAASAVEIASSMRHVLDKEASNEVDANLTHRISHLNQHAPCVVAGGYLSSLHSALHE